MGKRDLPVISLFSGAMGLDLGLESAGFRIAVALESDRFAAETIRTNRPDIPLLDQKIEDVTTRRILAKAGLQVGEAALVVAGPCCQAFSTAGQRGSMSDPRGGMFREFLRVVRQARPRFFVMENVRGILSAAVKHRPLNKRGPGFPSLRPEEELGSAFRLIVSELEALEYYTLFGLLNSADYGVPQSRERVIFIGSRDGEPLAMPEATHSVGGRNGSRPWVTLRQALKGLDDPDREHPTLTPRSRKYLKLIPEGGNWRDLPKRMQAPALGAASKSWGGRSGFLRRLAWDRPAPSLPTRPDCRATMLCHPTELRPLSVREYAQLQQFPETWEFAGGLPQRYRQIGNAVPVGLGVAVGQAIRRAMRRRARLDARGSVLCADPELLERMGRRPRTVLNPPRMRRSKDPAAIAKWRDGRGRLRREFLDYPAIREP